MSNEGPVANQPVITPAVADVDAVTTALNDRLFRDIFGLDDGSVTPKKASARAHSAGRVIQNMYLRIDTGLQPVTSRS